jgi:tetratricopeptide (TPR) repeat protein
MQTKRNINIFSLVLNSIWVLVTIMIYIPNLSANSIDCNSFEDCYKKGRGLEIEEKYWLAARYYEKAIKLWSPMDGEIEKASAYYELAIFGYAPKSSIFYLSKAIELDPTGECGTGEKGSAYYKRALEYERDKQYEKAVDDCERAIELNPIFF